MQSSERVLFARRSESEMDDCGNFSLSALLTCKWLTFKVLFIQFLLCILYPTVRPHTIPSQLDIGVTPNPSLNGSQITLTCNTSSKMISAFYEWFKEGQSIAGANKKVYTTEARKGETYECRVSANEGRNFSLLSLPFTPKVFFALIKQDTKSVDGQPMTLSCETSLGNQVESFTWYKNDVKLEDATAKYKTIAHLDSDDCYYCKIFWKDGDETSPPYCPDVLPGSYFKPTSLSPRPRSSSSPTRHQSPTTSPTRHQSSTTSPTRHQSPTTSPTRHQSPTSSPTRSRSPSSSRSRHPPIARGPKWPGGSKFRRPTWRPGSSRHGWWGKPQKRNFPPHWRL